MTSCSNNPVSSSGESEQPSLSQSQGSAQSLEEQQSTSQQDIGQQPPPQQSQQQRNVYPWSLHRLLLPPPSALLNPGVEPPSQPSPCPFPRHGHALPTTATATGELFLFGGLVGNIAQNDLYSISTNGDLLVTVLQTALEIPSPRVGHASALIGNVLIMWGGNTKTNSKAKQSDKHDDGLYMLNLGE